MRVSHDLDAVLPELDVVGLLRVQQERMDDALIPSIHEYVDGFGITADRASAIRSDALITHPGPVVRGIEVTADVLDHHPGVLVTRQVTNGVAVRMAVLFWLLGSGVDIT